MSTWLSQRPPHIFQLCLCLFIILDHQGTTINVANKDKLWFCFDVTSKPNVLNAFDKEASSSLWGYSTPQAKRFTYLGRKLRERRGWQKQGGAPVRTKKSQNATQTKPSLCLCFQHSLIQGLCHGINSLGEPVSATAMIPTKRKGALLSIPKENS